MPKASYNKRRVRVEALNDGMAAGINSDGPILCKVTRLSYFLEFLIQSLAPTNEQSLLKLSWASDFQRNSFCRKQGHQISAF